MINITLTPTSPEELEAFLNVLEKRGLFAATATKIVPQKPIGNDPHSRGLARALELGFKRIPRPSNEEKDLRILIDKERRAAKEKPIDWSDFLAREAALLEKDYSFDRSEDEGEGESEPEPLEVEIDLENPVQ